MKKKVQKNGKTSVTVEVPPGDAYEPNDYGSDDSIIEVGAES